MAIVYSLTELTVEVQTRVRLAHGVFETTLDFAERLPSRKHRVIHSGAHRKLAAQKEPWISRSMIPKSG